MFDGDNEADEIIRADRKNFPGCGYSTNVKSTCGSDEAGQFVCRTIKQIQRNCPGEAPVSVYNKTTKGDSNGLTIFGDLFGLARKGKQLDKRIEKGELEHDIKEVQKSLEEVMGGGHHDLKGMFDELMKEAHRGNQVKPRPMPRERELNSQGVHPHHRPHQQRQQQLPYAQEYDKLVEEAMDGLMDDDKQSAVGRRRGTKSGDIEKI